MPNFKTLEPINPTPIFHMDWEVNMKCNLDCSYCGSHDNSIKHPSLESCLNTVDFLLRYADLYMSYKPVEHRVVLLNLFGGEAIYHPNFIDILEAARKKYEVYKDKWQLRIHCITNAVTTEKKWKEILKHVDSFTISYHTESTVKQQNQTKHNLLLLKDTGKWYQCSVLMHPDHFENNLEMIEFCKENGINYLPRQLDQTNGNTRFNYKQEQVIWFDNLYKRKSTIQIKSVKLDDAKQTTEKSNMSGIGRACCGGESFAVDGNFQEKAFFIPDNRFQGWSCSVNWFFIFIKQVENNIYLNKDCRMTFDGTVGPLGSLDDSEEILKKLEEDLKNNSLPIIKCNKEFCRCGLCAPKAESTDLYNQVMDRYVIPISQ
jgi:sulfatase maturation enzyme AslB (radical SAM superfamily)